MDSINVCGRIHDLVCWSRVAGYAHAQFHDLLYGAPRRAAFEYYFPNLCALPMADYPFFVRAMRARRDAPPDRWHGLTDEEAPVAEKMLAHMRTAGPLRTRQTGNEDGHTMSGWGMRRTLASHVVEKLWLHGRLVIARRDNFERTFDLAERYLPPELVAHHGDNGEATLPSHDEERAFRALKRLRARRLFPRPRPDELRVLGSDAIVPVQIAGASRTWYALAEDEQALRQAENGAVTADGVNFVAPLDPLVYDRQRTRDVFGFDYTWEVYTPEAKRRWGYYVLPILWGERLAGRMDPKIDRKTGTLMLHSLRLEVGVDAAAIAGPLAACLANFARFLGATRLRLTLVEPETLRPLLVQALPGWFDGELPA